MTKYVRVMDGLKSNAGGFDYKLDEINVAEKWDPTSLEPEKMGGFNFGTEDKILRWLHRGDTIYDVVIPDDAEVILCDSETFGGRTSATGQFYCHQTFPLQVLRRFRETS